MDANLLCLLVVGRADRAAISSHPRLRAFTIEDFANVLVILERLGDLILCPHVLAETSNLLGYRQTPQQRRRWLTSLGEIVCIAQERSETAKRAVADNDYGRLGLTDAVLLLLSGDEELALVSDDLQLCLEGARRGARTINYNYVRDGALRVDQL